MCQLVNMNFRVLRSSDYDRGLRRWCTFHLTTGTGKLVQISKTNATNNLKHLADIANIFIDSIEAAQ